VTAQRTRKVIEGYEYLGTTAEIVYEQKLSLRLLKKPQQLIEHLDQVTEQRRPDFDEMRRECRDGFVRVIGVKRIRDRMAGLGGTLTYARLSNNPLFGDYRELGENLPAYDHIAAYVFYTETSTQWPGGDRRKNKAFDKKTGKIGEHGGRSYYLLYQPNEKLDAGLDAEFLSEVAANDPNHELVVYCEKVWVHKDQLRAFTAEHHKRVRPMLVPFSLK